MTRTLQRVALRRNHDWPRWDEPVFDRRDLRWSVTAGLAVTVVVHLLLASIIPWDVLLRERQPQPQAQLRAVEYLPPEPVPPERFVETNPDAPLETPEETDQIAARDQRAAQEIPDPLEDSPMPEVDGEREDAHKIVETEVFIEPDGVPGVGFADSPSPAGEADADGVETVPGAPGDAADAVDPVAESSMEDPVDAGSAAADLPESPEGVPAEPLPEQETTVDIIRHPHFDVITEQPAGSVREGAPVAEPRPRIQMRVPPGPLMRTPSASGRMGAVAIDAKFSEFGEYQQRMIEAISAQWHILGNQARYTGSDIGTRVEVHFTLTREGEVDDLRVVRSSASRAGTIMVVDSIQSRAPFGLWTREMVRVLGDSQTVRITFFYR